MEQAVQSVPQLTKAPFSFVAVANQQTWGYPHLDSAGAAFHRSLSGCRI